VSQGWLSIDGEARKPEQLTKCDVSTKLVAAKFRSTPWAVGDLDVTTASVMDDKTIVFLVLYDQGIGAFKAIFVLTADLGNIQGHPITTFNSHSKGPVLGMRSR
jgi:hypothetical protein